MSWISLTLLAAIFQSVSYLFSKYTLANISRNFYLATFNWTIIATIIFGFIGLQNGPINTSPILVFGGTIVGILYSLGFFLQFKGLCKIDVSKYAPLQALNPVFVLIYATLVFKEYLFLHNYLGIILIIIGGTVTSFKRDEKSQFKRFKFDTTLLIAVISALIFATKNILTKHLSFAGPLLSLMTWIATGTLFSAIFILIFHGKKLRFGLLKQKGLENFFAVALFAVLGSVSFTTAVNSGPVSLVTFLDKIQIVFLFIIAMFLGWLKPKLLREKFSKEIFIQKLISVIFILIGSSLLSF